MKRRSLLMLPIASMVAAAETKTEKIVELDPEKKYLVICDIHKSSQQDVGWIKRALHDLGIEAVVIHGDKDALKLYELEPRL